MLENKQIKAGTCMCFTPVFIGDYKINLSMDLLPCTQWGWFDTSCKINIFECVSPVYFSKNTADFVYAIVVLLA